MTKEKTPDFALLKKALQSLKISLDMTKDDIVRDSCIQRFEYSFELSWKSLKKYFLWNQNLHESNVRNLFREAGKAGLIDNVEEWFDFHRARNLSSHTYNEDLAEEIYLTAQSFYKAAIILLERIEKLSQ